MRGLRWFAFAFLVSGCPSAPQNTVVRLEQPTGADCAMGGYVELSGVDTNNDGILEAEEVTSKVVTCYGPDGGADLAVSEDLSVAAPPPDLSATAAPDLSVALPADFAIAVDLGYNSDADESCIEGDVTITAADGPVFSHPEITCIRGQLLALSDSALYAIDLPNLRHADKLRIEWNPNLIELNLSALVSVGPWDQVVIPWNPVFVISNNFCLENDSVFQAMAAHLTPPLIDGQSARLSNNGIDLINPIYYVCPDHVP